VRGLHASLDGQARRLAEMVRRHSHAFKMATKRHQEDLLTFQVQQSRLADNAVRLFALTAALAKMDHQLRTGEQGPAFERDQAAFEHLFDLFELEFAQSLGEMRTNADDSMRRAAAAARRHNDTLPNGDYYVHEASPVARGTGHPVQRDHIRQFPGDRSSEPAGDGAASGAPSVEARPSPRKAGTPKS